ncbi:DUF2946 family protein [Neoroseomonas terrae]|uniref:DUF2946 family protein n=1 Tax=Neoroseomonas terrae TaxID=424799 RepID=UPI0038D164FB
MLDGDTCDLSRRPLDKATVKRALHAVGPFLSLLLLLQVVLAPLHCLAMARSADGFTAVICSPDGMRVVQLDADGREQPGTDGAACFVCADTARATLPEPLLLSEPSPQPVGLAWHTAAAASLPPPGRAPPYAPRGPPPYA